VTFTEIGPVELKGISGIGCTPRIVRKHVEESLAGRRAGDPRQETRAHQRSPDRCPDRPCGWLPASAQAIHKPTGEREALSGAERQPLQMAANAGVLNSHCVLPQLPVGESLTTCGKAG
jgi:hypothetical protein